MATGPSATERRHALAQIMRGLFGLDEDLMEAARTREVLCHHFDRDEVMAAWGEAMRAMKEKR
jgi:hypothetical protein